MGRILKSTYGTFEVPINKLKEWYKYARIETVLQEGGWNRLFPDQDDPTCCILDGYDEERKDQIKIGIYTLLDQLVNESQRGASPTVDEVYEYASTKCNLPFTTDSTRRIVQELVSHFHDSKLLRLSQDKLNLSTLTRWSS